MTKLTKQLKKEAKEWQSLGYSLVKLYPLQAGYYKLTIKQVKNRIH